MSHSFSEKQKLLVTGAITPTDILLSCYSAKLIPKCEMITTPTHCCGAHLCQQPGPLLGSSHSDPSEAKPLAQSQRGEAVAWHAYRAWPPSTHRLLRPLSLGSFRIYRILISQSLAHYPFTFISERSHVLSVFDVGFFGFVFSIHVWQIIFPVGIYENQMYS